MLRTLFLSLLLSGPAPFVLVNGSGTALDNLSVRLTGSDSRWRSLGPGQLGPAGRAPVPALGGEDCAFDVRGQAGSATLVWLAVNLCDVKVVTLRRGQGGTLWVDYD